LSVLPNLKPRQVVSALKRAGFVEHHQKGSHLYLFHPQARRMTSVPMHPGDVKSGTLRAIVKQAGLSEEQFRQLV
jgi:predicted RNA binding protein YcfA (HicA-like mRNA interferase family)